MLFGTRRPPRLDRGRRRRRSVFLLLEPLEDRLTPSAVPVGTVVAEASLSAAQTAVAANVVQSVLTGPITPDSNTSAPTPNQPPASPPPPTLSSATVTAPSPPANSAAPSTASQASGLTDNALDTLSQQMAGVSSVVPSSLLSNAAAAGSLVSQAAVSTSLMAAAQNTLLTTARGLSQQVLSFVSSLPGTTSVDPEAEGENSSLSALSSSHASSSASASDSSVTISFTPDRLIYAAGQSSVNVAAVVVNSTTGSAVSGGTLTFTLTDAEGVAVNPSVSAAVSSNGQASGTYPLPIDLAAGAYTVRAAYSSSDGSPSGNGSEPLSLVFPPAPAQRIPMELSSSFQDQGSAAPSAPLQPPPSLLQAALALYLDGAEMLLNQLSGHAGAAVQANIDFNTPYARLYSPLLVLAGELAASHAVQPPQ